VKKLKKKRVPKHSFSGESGLLPFEVVVVDTETETQLMFCMSNRGIKMLKEGKIHSRKFLKDGKMNNVMVMHTDVYDQEFKSKVDARKRYLQEKKRQEIEKAQEENPVDVESDEVYGELDTPV